MQLLRARAKDAHHVLLYIAPKAHYLQHLPDEARLTALRVVHCYTEESYIEQLAQIWASSKHAPYKNRIQFMTLLMYLVWRSIELYLTG